MKKCLKFLFLAAYVLAVSIVLPPAHIQPVQAATTTTSSSTLQQQLDALQQQIGQLAKQKQDIVDAIKNAKDVAGNYKNQINGISNERNLIESQVQEKQLSIQALDLQMQILTQSISDNETTIAATEAQIADLQKEADKQLSEMYQDIKTQNLGINAIFANGGLNIVKAGLYQQTIQDGTNNSLASLNEQNSKLQTDKQQLESDKDKVTSDKTTLAQDQSDLVTQQQQLQSKINTLNALVAQSNKSIADNQNAQNSLDDQAKKLLAQESLIEQELFNKIGSVPSGTYVVAGQGIGVQGCTGLCTGPHAHFGVMKNGAYQNPCNYLPAGRFSNCAGDGELQWPLHGTFYYTSSYGYRTIGDYSSFHAGIDIANPVANSPVYAAHDGWLVRGFEPCNPSYWLCKGGGAHYAIICQDRYNCKNGWKTLYWHLQY